MKAIIAVLLALAVYAAIALRPAQTRHVTPPAAVGEAMTLAHVPQGIENGSPGPTDPNGPA